MGRKPLRASSDGADQGGATQIASSTKRKHQEMEKNLVTYTATSDSSSNKRTDVAQPKGKRTKNEKAPAAPPTSNTVKKDSAASVAAPVRPKEEQKQKGASMNNKAMQTPAKKVVKAIKPLIISLAVPLRNLAKTRNPL